MQETKQIYYSYINHKDLKIFVATTSKGLCYVSTQINSEEEAAEHLKSYIKNFTLEENAKITRPYEKQLIEYVEGNRQVFDCPLDTYGTLFQQSVWKALSEIPFGQTTTYSNIAETIGNPKAIRAVGTAIGRNPLLIVIPCHRVIRKNGDLSGFREGIDLKKRLLTLERK